MWAPPMNLQSRTFTCFVLLLSFKVKKESAKGSLGLCLHLGTQTGKRVSQAQHLLWPGQQRGQGCCDTLSRRQWHRQLAAAWWGRQVKGNLEGCIWNTRMAALLWLRAARHCLGWFCSDSCLKSICEMWWQNSGAAGAADILSKWKQEFPGAFLSSSWVLGSTGEILSNQGMLLDPLSPFYYYLSSMSEFLVPASKRLGLTEQACCITGNLACWPLCCRTCASYWVVTWSVVDGWYERKPATEEQQPGLRQHAFWSQEEKVTKLICSCSLLVSDSKIQ